MLKRKLENQYKNAQTSHRNQQQDDSKQTCPYFKQKLWQNFYDIEMELNEALSKLQSPSNISYIYNPIEYASEIHCEYLKKYLTNRKKCIFVGMNPGSHGMGQTGVPFGNVATVRDVMQLRGNVKQPQQIHSKRPINGLNHTTEEQSGKRLWGLLQHLAEGDLDVFFEQCFVHNFCPLMFFDRNAKNITPNELRGTYQQEIRDVCMKALEELLELQQCEVIVAVGEYVYRCLQRSEFCSTKTIFKLPHPSPRTKGNENWISKTDELIRNSCLLPYILNKPKS